MVQFTAYAFGLALMMFITGTINTISIKYADNEVAVGSNGVPHLFDHPFVQACFMFLGEMQCLWVFLVLSWCTVCLKPARYLGVRNKAEVTPDHSIQEEAPAQEYVSPFIFFPPAMCDMTATSLSYVALNLTYASSYQMLRGSVIVFTGLTSIIVLRRRGTIEQWVGMFTVVVGLVLIGVSDLLTPGVDNPDAPDPIVGDIIIVLSQMVVAVQMVIEEKFVVGRKVHPMATVGWEGWFGFFVLSFLLIPMYFIHVGPTFSDSPEYRLEDPIDAFTQMVNNPTIFIWMMVNVISIAFFNFSGVSVTKELNATTRMVLDSLRTFAIWAYSLIVGWQAFQWLQLLGFAIMFIGTCIYNDILIFPLLRKYNLLPRFLDHPTNPEPVIEADPLLKIDEDT
jgi:drug/metabolite transporter (DMT)-like permease